MSVSHARYLGKASLTNIAFKHITNITLAKMYLPACWQALGKDDISDKCFVSLENRAVSASQFLYT